MAVFYPGRAANLERTILLPLRTPQISLQTRCTDCRPLGYEALIIHKIKDYKRISLKVSDYSTPGDCFEFSGELWYSMCRLEGCGALGCGRSAMDANKIPTFGMGLRGRSYVGPGNSI